MSARSRPASRADWKTLPYDGPWRPLACAETFTTTECERLRHGLVPEVMEDKWFVFFEDPYLHFHRSWTGELAYRARLEHDASGGRITSADASDLVTTSYGRDYESALLSFLLRGLLLGQPVAFPVPPEGAPGPPGLFQHAVSGTGFPEERRPGSRPPGGTALARLWRRLTRRP